MLRFRRAGRTAPSVSIIRVTRLSFRQRLLSHARRCSGFTPMAAAPSLRRKPSEMRVAAEGVAVRSQSDSASGVTFSTELS